MVAIGKGIAAGLQAAHRAGLVHRDLKPANVLVAPGDVARIVDFGLARATSFAGVDRRSFALVGTPDYMAPESADPLAIDPRSDLYSLGCILYEMMAGHPPFGGATPFAVLQAHIEEPLPALERRTGALRGAGAPGARAAGQVAGRPAAVGRAGGAGPGRGARAGRRRRRRPGAGPATCARCGAPLLDGVPVCFGCAMEQGAVEAGPVHGLGHRAGQEHAQARLRPAREAARLDARQARSSASTRRSWRARCRACRSCWSPG